MKKTAIFLCAGLMASTAHANEFEPAIQDYLNAEILGWVENDVLISAIRAQNDAFGMMTEDEILELDQAWRAEVGMSETPTIAPVLNNAAANFLVEIVNASGGTVTEIFIMDHQGLNVAASATTSDYWQGDEAKFQKTYPMGPGATFIDEVEFDESTQSYQVQVSLTLADPATGQAIGAMTVGLNADELF